MVNWVILSLELVDVYGLIFSGDDFWRDWLLYNLSSPTTLVEIPGKPATS